MDVSIEDMDIQKTAKCTLSVTEASLDCAAKRIDPEDPRCVRLALSGTMVNVTSESEKQRTKSVLFEQHPAMKSWPADHSWLIQKLDIEHIWLVSAFGGALDVPLTDYFGAPPPSTGQPMNPAHEPKHRKPFFPEKGATARWLVHESTWATLATTSVHLGGMAFANPISLSDGPDDNATGIPYMLLSTMDTSTEDLLKNDNCTLTFSQAEVNCGLHGITGPLDPEDPRCTRLSLTGRMEGVTDLEEKQFAEEALVAEHPSMKMWLGFKDFHLVKLHIQYIWLIDFFGGASEISVEKYYNVKNERVASLTTASRMDGNTATLQYV